MCDLIQSVAVMYMWVVWRRGGKMWICDFGASKSNVETADMQSRSAFWYLLIIRVSGEMKHEDKKVNRSALLSCAVFGQVFPPRALHRILLVSFQLREQTRRKRRMNDNNFEPQLYMVSKTF